MSAVFARLLERDGDFRRTVRIEAAPGSFTVLADTPSREPAALPQQARPNGGSVLYLPDGTRCEVEDTRALDSLLAEARMRQVRRGKQFLASLGWQCAVLFMLALAALATVSYRWLAPELAAVLASGVSSSTLRAASEKALQKLDNTWLAPSKLNEASQNALRTRFASLILPAGEGVAWRLVFREGGHAGAQAFSLPDGDIILTDEMVKSAASDEVVVAVLAHQFAHLQRKDAMLGLSLHSPLLVLRAWFGGEENAARLATGLLETSLDSVAGTEADHFAKQLMLANGIPLNTLSLLRSALPPAPAAGRLPPLLNSR